MIEPKGNNVLIDCYECKAKVSDNAAACPHCGAVSQSDDAMPVIVTDMDMRISSMIWFLLKAAIAAVPAAIIIYTAWAIIGGVMSPLLRM